MTMKGKKIPAFSVFAAQMAGFALLAYLLIKMNQMNVAIPNCYYMSLPYYSVLCNNDDTILPTGQITLQCGLHYILVGAVNVSNNNLLCSEI